MDYITVGCTLSIFLALIAVVSISYFAIDNRYIGYARKLDTGARGFPPAVFIGLLFWFVSG